MTQEHPITPPPDLVRHWSRFQGDTNPEALWLRIANEAAQWGADQELEACCELIDQKGFLPSSLLRLHRRPKPPSLKEQALALINHDPANQPFLSDKGIDTIRRALEQLDD
jgi:hypothetical protein